MRTSYLIFFLLLFTLSAQAQTVSKKDSTANAPTVSDLRPAPNMKMISISDAAANVGQEVLVGGKVFGHKITDSAVMLYLGADYPNQKLTVELKGRAITSIKLGEIDGNIVTLSGIVKMAGNQPQITVNTGIMALPKPRK